MAQTCPVGVFTQALFSLPWALSLSLRKQMLVGRIWSTHLETTVGGPRAAWGKLAHPRQALRYWAWGRALAKAGVALIYTLGPR